MPLPAPLNLASPIFLILGWIVEFRARRLDFSSDGVVDSDGDGKQDDDNPCW